jgi:hypothetical protein
MGKLVEPKRKQRELVRTLAMVFLLTALAGAQKAGPPAAAASSTQDYSGMYTFLREGEFVQVTVEEAGHVTGFISRYGDSESDQGAFLDQFFKVGKLEGHNLSFTTQTVHDTWFEFKGTVDRGPAKTRAQEGYYLLKGTLTEYVTDLAKKVSAKTREVEFKLFPEDAGPAPQKRD